MIKKTLTPNDWALITGQAYPGSASNVYQFWNFNEGRPMTLAERSSLNPDTEFGSDGFAEFLVEECSGGDQHMEVFDAFSSINELLQSVRVDILQTIERFEKYVTMAISAMYVDWLVTNNFPHSGLKYKAWLDLYVPRDSQAELHKDIEHDLSFGNGNWQDINKNVLAKLRLWLSIQSDLLPVGVSKEPLFEQEPNHASNLDQPAETFRSSACSADGQTVAKEGVPESPAPSVSGVQG